ncbi:MAG: hypothetical protein WA484_00925 [Solirubrobacteraceae bacterium]
MAWVAGADLIEPGGSDALLVGEGERVGARDCHLGYSLVGASVFAGDHRGDP